MNPLPLPLDAQAWTRISPLLDELFELPPGQRGPRLQQACQGEERLKAYLEGLLAADADAGLFLDSAAAAGFHDLVADGAGPEAPEAEDEGAPGARIGPWRLVRELGRGGMGAVFLGERDDGQFEQQVALKVVKRGMDTDEVLRRFLAERRILAQLHHAHIARLLDGGVTEDGRPYFAMEYVDGEPIVAYCLARGLDRDARLRLLQGVCDAVQYAHRKLVVHRDLKPSNILVTSGGQAKLLDFGIAKLLDSDEGVTLTGERVMTPEYAAPEQVRGEPATTATDVFALGLLLHELVAGRRWKRARAGDEPRVGHPDLDAILESALRDEPEKRYPSVQALAEDVRRFLQGLPVLARAGTALYRAAKFVRRHRVGVAAAAVTLIASLAGVAGTLWQARAATKEAARAREAKDFLVSVFEVSDPNKGGENVTARDLLDRGASRIERKLSEQPDLVAELLGVVGHIYERLGDFARAAPLLEKDLAMRRRRHGEGSVEVAETLSCLADLHYGKGDLPQSEALRRQALDIHRRRRAPAHPATVHDADELARLLIDRGRHEEAKILIDATLEEVRRDRGEENEDYANCLNTRQRLLFVQGNYAEAEPAMRRVVEIRLRLFGERHTLVSQGFSNLGTIALSRGDAQEAERMFRRALAIGTDLYGGEHPNLGITLNNLSKALQEQGRIDEAIPVQRRALALRTAQLGEGNPSLAVNFHNLALLLRERGQYAEAIALLRQAVAMNRKLLGDEHVSQAITFGSLALVLREAGQPAEAEPLFRRARELFHKNHLEKHMKFPEVLEGLGVLLVDTGRAAEAEDVLRQAVDRRREGLGDEAWRTAAAKARLAQALQALGRHDEARAVAAEALPVLRRERGESDPSTRLALAVATARPSPPRRR